MTPNTTVAPKEPKDLRLRNKHFPNASQLIFDKGKKGYVPLPILMRKAMRYLSAPELRVLIYLQTRASQYGICYPTLDEMAHELNLGGTRNLTPHIKQLVKNKFISLSSGGGKKFFLVHDPLVALLHLAQTGKVSKDDLFDIDELLASLKRETLTDALDAAANAAPAP